VNQRKVIPIAVGRAEPPASDATDWRRLTTLAEPRLSEMAQNYRALGYEVEIREVQQTDSDGCTTCLDAGQAMGRVYATLYVRRVGTPQGDEEWIE
jgi:hypothetical protein